MSVISDGAAQVSSSAECEVCGGNLGIPGTRKRGVVRAARCNWFQLLATYKERLMVVN